MRELSPNNLSTADPKRGSRSAPSDAKSLFRNILAASPSGSRFYPDPTLARDSQAIKNEHFSRPRRKNSGGGGGVIQEAQLPKASWQAVDRRDFSQSLWTKPWRFVLEDWGPASFPIPKFRKTHQRHRSELGGVCDLTAAASLRRSQLCRPCRPK
jgi:hypothetical protein